MEITTPQDYENDSSKRQRRSLRPCDACRKRKTRCVTKDGDGGCVHCQLRATACTFHHEPPKRQATTGASSNSAYSSDERGGEGVSGGGLDDLPGLGGGGPGGCGPGGSGIGIGRDHHHRQGPSTSRSLSLGRGRKESPAETQASKLHNLGSDMKPIRIHWPHDIPETHAICHILKRDAGQEYPVSFHLPPDEKAVELDLTPLLMNSIEGYAHPHHFTINPVLPNVLFIGSGGTIAGVNRLHEPATEYTPGVVGIDSLVEGIPQLRDICNVRYKQVTNVDSIDINSTILEQIRLGVQDGLNNPEYAGVVVWHETDTLEETAEYIYLTTFNEKPVVLTGATRPSTDPSPDGPMNLLSSAVVACSADSKNRGALVVFNNQIYSASMIMKKDSNSVDAFTSQSRLGTVHNNIAQFLFQPSRPTDDHYFAVNSNVILPRVDIVYEHQGCGDVDLLGRIRKGVQGLVLAGFEGGYWKTDAIDGSLAMLARLNFPVVMAGRTMHGFVARRYGFVGAGYLSVGQARIRLQLVIATGEDPRRLFIN